MLCAILDTSRYVINMACLSEIHSILLVLLNFSLVEIRSTGQE